MSEGPMFPNSEKSMGIDAVESIYEESEDL